MRWLYRKYAHFILRPYWQWKLSKMVVYRSHGLRMEIPPGVFHPGYFFSTEYLLAFLLRQDWKDKGFLELGCGSGLISLVLAGRGARVTAVDINPAAVIALQQNASVHQLELEVRESDLFSALNDRRFSAIAINPPYYRKDPADMAQRAWYAGGQFEYFKALFATLRPHLLATSQVWMVLSEDCALREIETIAHQHHFELKLLDSRTFRFEAQNIYGIIDRKLTSHPDGFVS